MCPCRMELKTLLIFVVSMKFFLQLSASVRTLSSTNPVSILWPQMFSGVSRSAMKDLSRAIAEFFPLRLASVRRLF